MELEHWKDIVEYEGYYQVSNFGRVKSIARTGRKRDKILKTYLNGTRPGNKYLSVFFHKDRKRKVCKVHRLVALMFVPNPDRLPQVNHLDKNKFNNHVSNLEWVSARENNTHKNLGESSSKYVGVSWCKPLHKWNAYIRINGQRKNLGYFKSEKDAAKAYQNALTRNCLTNKYAYET